MVVLEALAWVALGFVGGIGACGVPWSSLAVRLLMGGLRGGTDRDMP
jgi:hypothetical protein